MKESISLMLWNDGEIEVWFFNGTKVVVPEAYRKSWGEIAEEAEEVRRDRMKPELKDPPLGTDFYPRFKKVEERLNEHDENLEELREGMRSFLKTFMTPEAAEPKKLEIPSFILLAAEQGMPALRGKLMWTSFGPFGILRFFHYISLEQKDALLNKYESVFKDVFEASFEQRLSSEAYNKLRSKQCLVMKWKVDVDPEHFDVVTCD